MKIYSNDKSDALRYYRTNKADCLINHIYFNGFLSSSLFYFSYNFNLFSISFTNSGINDVHLKCSDIVLIIHVLLGRKIFTIGLMQMHTLKY